jgi:hypothetical protein
VPAASPVGAQPAPTPPAPVGAPDPHPSAAPPQPPEQPAEAPPVQWSTPAEAEMDAVTPDEEKTKLLWRGSTFTFNQAGTTTVFGVGRDNIGGEDEFYGWDFTFRPIVYLLDRGKDTVRAFADIGWATELTDGSTVERRETQFKDVQLGVRYGRELWKSGGVKSDDYKTDGSLSLRAALPTSPVSYRAGRYLTLALSPQVSQKVKLLGTKADGLNDVTVTLGLTYAHLFARATQPTNRRAERYRMNKSGTFLSDALGGSSFDIDRLTTRLGLTLPLYKDLSLATAYGLISRWRGFDGSDCEVAVPNVEGGCVSADRLENSAKYQVMASFDLALSYPLYEVVSLTLGYNNETNQLGEDGKRRNFFYSPDAQFYLDITANLDSIYSKVTGRGAKKPSTAAGPSKLEL